MLPANNPKGGSYEVKKIQSLMVDGRDSENAFITCGYMCRMDNTIFNGHVKEELCITLHSRITEG